ncbi:hypothetical protein ACHAPT_004165 [Fusarium lateritium]
MPKACYFLAPDFTTAPPPKGPIKLGTILFNVTEFDILDPIVQEIPEADLCPVDEKTVFVISLRELHSADFGLKAKVSELLDLHSSASIERTKGRDSLLSCQCLETITFNPTESYINDSVNNSKKVGLYLRSGWLRGTSVYMVTGLKVARGASFTSSTSNTVTLETDSGLVPSGIPVSAGVRAGYESNIEEGEKWDASTDFIVAFKVRKIWLDRKEQVKHQAYNQKAVMQDGTSSRCEPELTIRSDEKLTEEELEEMFDNMEDDDI